MEKEQQNVEQENEKKIQMWIPALIAYKWCKVPLWAIMNLIVLTTRNQSYDYLKWLCYTHNGARVVAIVTQDKVPWAFGQFLLSKGYLENS